MAGLGLNPMLLLQGASPPQDFNTLAPKGTPTPFGLESPDFGVPSIIDQMEKGDLLPKFNQEDAEGLAEARKAASQGLIRLTSLLGDVERLDMMPEARNPVHRLKNHLRRAFDPNFEPKRRFEATLNKLKLTTEIVKGISDLSGVVDTLSEETETEKEIRKVQIKIAGERASAMQALELGRVALHTHESQRREMGLPPLSPQEREDILRSFQKLPALDRSADQNRLDAMAASVKGGIDPATLVESLGAERVAQVLGPNGAKMLERVFAQGEADRKAELEKKKADAERSKTEAKKSAEDTEAAQREEAKALLEEVTALAKTFRNSDVEEVTSGEGDALMGFTRKKRKIYSISQSKALRIAAAAIIKRDPKVAELLGPQVETLLEGLRMMGDDDDRVVDDAEIQREMERRTSGRP